MGQIVLGGKTAGSNINAGTELDPMFSELYGWFAGLNLSSTTHAGMKDGGFLGIGAYYDIGATTWKNTNGSQGGIALINGGGHLQFWCGTSPGSAGTAFGSFLEKWRLTNGGQLLAGRTTQLSGGTLEVSGNVVLQPSASAPTLGANGDMSFQLVSNTSLKILVRGSDGVTRSATLTLS